MEKVSVVIPCYNHGQYIDKAVDSLLGQTYTNIEIIIIDDGSTDQFTIEKLHNYKKTKTTVFHTKNQGPAAARNYGIAQTNGDYILVLDADDYFEQTFLEKATEILVQKAEVGIVACGVQYFGLNNGKYIPEAKNVESFLIGCPLFGSALFRKVCWEQTGGYDKDREGFYYEDWEFWLDITKRGWDVHVLQEHLFYYRWHDRSRRTEIHKIRLEAIRQLVNNHKELYSQKVEFIFLEQERRILTYKKTIRQANSSLECRLGSIITAPLRFVQKFLSKSSGNE